MAQVITAAPAQAAPTTLRPLHDRVPVKRVGEPEDTNGSILIPDSAREKPQDGTVIAVGAGSGATLGAERYLGVLDS